MIQNTVELRVFTVGIVKDYSNDVKQLIEKSEMLEKYIQGEATIPDVVEDPNNIWLKAFEEMRKNTFSSPQPLPELKPIKTSKAKKK
jgi:hypothetical protein